MKKGQDLFKMPFVEIMKQLDSGKTIEEIRREFEYNDEEDYGDIQYIDLVYPPGSDPPIRKSVKKMNFIGLKYIPFK
jgi:hypothetical protein